MLNSGPYNILNKDPSTNHLIEVKYNVKNSVLFNDQTKRVVITVSYKLAHFLSQSVAHLTYNNFYTVKNSYDFVDKLKIIFLSNYTMLSHKLYYAFSSCQISFY